MRNRQRKFSCLFLLIISLLLTFGCTNAQAFEPLQFKPKSFSKLNVGTVFLVGDHITESDSGTHNSVIRAKGHARLLIVGQDSELHAGEISIDWSDCSVTAHGCFGITGENRRSFNFYSAIQFGLNSDQYLSKRKTQLKSILVYDRFRNQYAFALLPKLPDAFAPTSKTSEPNKLLVVNTTGIPMAQDDPIRAIGVRDGVPVSVGPASRKYEDGTDIPEGALQWAY